jgi:very-short-patch-repair endonuclease
MSLNHKYQLVQIAKILCRDLRKNSTKAERVLWEKLRNRQLLGKKFYRQYPIFYDILGKESFFIADFFCYSSKLIIELDGDYHKFRLTEDSHRTKILNQLGLKVIRFTNEEIIKDIEKVLDKIGKNLK